MTTISPRDQKTLELADAFRACDLDGYVQARAALVAHLQSEPQVLFTDWDVRGILASSLKCWHRLTEAEADDLVEFYKSQVSRPISEPQGWKDIATAPHNANPVLALSESGNIKIETGYWLVNLLHASKVDGEKCNYTHWQPLPAAPKEGV